MKKVFALILSICMIFALCACGAKSKDVDENSYSGTWVRETWKNEKTGAEVNITLYLYDDFTFKEEVNNSVDGYKEYQGEWKVSKNTIEIMPTKLVAGSDINFGDDGRLKDGISNPTQTLNILDSITLENNNIKYNKQH